MPLPSLVDAGFDPAPSIKRFAEVSIAADSQVPSSATAVGVPVPSQGRVPARVGVDRRTLAAAGFDGSLGSSLLVPRSDGPTIVALGVGDPTDLEPAGLRDIAAAFARATERHRRIAMTFDGLTSCPPRPTRRRSSRASSSRAIGTTSCDAAARPRWRR